MRIGHRRGVVEGMMVGAAIAGSRRPATVIVPGAYAAPAYYGQPMSAAAYYPPPARGPTTEVVINTAPAPGAYPPQGAPYYPPASQPYPQPMSSSYVSVDTTSYPSPMAPPAAPINVAPYQDPAYNPSYSQGYNPPPYAMPAAASAPGFAAPAAVAMETKPLAPITAAAVVAGAEIAAVAKAIERRHFLIVNEANCSVLEVERGVIKPNTLLVADKRRQERPAYQIWYMDEGGVIRSKLNDFAIESKEHSERLRLMPYTGDARQKWILVGNRILNETFRNDCLGLKKGLIRLKEDADVVTGPYEGKPYQHWRIEYI